MAYKQSEKCTGKRSYKSRNEAKDSLFAERRRFPKLAFEVYHCPECGAWHIGHDRKYRNLNVASRSTVKKWRRHIKDGFLH
jgi:predicted RNA-binding Zn-ribbon protein involved in translation (DUF1610 family)